MPSPDTLPPYAAAPASLASPESSEPSEQITAHDLQNKFNSDVTKDMSREFYEEFSKKIKKTIEERGVRAKTINNLYLYEQGEIGKTRKDLPFRGSSDLRPQPSLQMEREIVPGF